METNLLEISKNITCRNGYSVSVSQLNEAFLSIAKRNNIFFGKNKFHFNNEDSKEIPAISFDEDYIFSIFYDLNQTNFTYLLEYVDGDFYLHFTEDCFRQAYSIYMYINNLCRIEDLNNRAYGELNEIVGKTFNEIHRNLQRLFYTRRFSFKEIGISTLEDEEKDYLFSFLNASH